MAAHIIEHHRYLLLRQLLDQAEKFLTLHAHELSLRRQPLASPAIRRARCVPDRTAISGVSRAITATGTRD
jgi:hypothetical protein